MDGCQNRVFVLKLLGFFLYDYIVKCSCSRLKDGTLDIGLLTFFHVLSSPSSAHCAEVLHIPGLDSTKFIPAQNFCLFTSKMAQSLIPVLDMDLRFINNEVCIV